MIQTYNFSSETASKIKDFNFKIDSLNKERIFLIVVDELGYIQLYNVNKNEKIAKESNFYILLFRNS